MLKDKRDWGTKRMGEVQENFSVKETRKFQMGVRNLKLELKPRVEMCEDKKRNLVGDRTSVLGRWAEYFEKVLNAERNINIDHDRPGPI